MKVYIANAFSLNMLPAGSKYYQVNVNEISVDEVEVTLKNDFEVVSCVGHADTANLFSKLLDYPVAFNRVPVKLEARDMLFVGQVNGRLPEGCTELPEGVTITWYLVTLS
jgi:hypothetical protein